jgi:hypothetical protein
MSMTHNINHPMIHQPDQKVKEDGLLVQDRLLERET